MLPEGNKSVGVSPGGSTPTDATKGTAQSESTGSSAVKPVLKLPTNLFQLITDPFKRLFEQAKPLSKPVIKVNMPSPGKVSQDFTRLVSNTAKHGIEDISKSLTNGIKNGIKSSLPTISIQVPSILGGIPAPSGGVLQAIELDLEKLLTILGL